MCSAGMSSCSHVKVTQNERNKMKIKKAREQYRIDLDKLRKETGCDIPFGANLDLYKNRSITVKKK